MENQTVYEYITTEESNFGVARVPLTGSKDWNFKEHIERCTNVANAWYHSGVNDGNRPYDDIVTPIINVAFRSENIDLKDIVPYVDNKDLYYKSFLVKKFHPQWARKHEIDTFIDDLVETSVIYDLVLVKNVNGVRPEVVDLKTIAFCDQTDVLAGALCIKHQYTVAEMQDFKDKWDGEKIDLCISQAKAEKSSQLANDEKVKTPSKYIEVYELRGNLPAHWLDTEEKKHGAGEYTNQLHIVAFYKDNHGNKQGITLYKGKDKPLTANFKSLKIDRIRSKGRACGRSIVETLFEPQVWNNYSAIKIKKLLDSAVTLFQTDSEEFGNQKLSELKDNTILKHEQGRPISKVDGSLQNLTAFQNYQAKQENSARLLGSASEAQLGKNPTSGTPFALQDLIVQEGEGIHEYRQGKIATFLADVLYRDWILGYLVKEMNEGKDFSEELTLEEISEIAETVATNQVEKKIKMQILDSGVVPNDEEREMMKEVLKDNILKGRTPMYSKGRGFFKILKGELEKIPMQVMVNINGKQKAMAKNATAITNILRTILQNPQAFAVPGVSSAFNELLENSGMSAIDFSQMTKLAPMTNQPLNSKAPEVLEEKEEVEV